MDVQRFTTEVRARALELGFDACGFARAEVLGDEARRLEAWLKEERHGSMEWMERHFDKRIDPTRLQPGTRSVISVIANYLDPVSVEYDRREDAPRIAKYARGRDYHKVFKKKLRTLFEYIRGRVGDVNGRVFVDSAPVMDKVWAERAGLGWIGKNSNLLNRDHGSFFLIGEILVDLPFEYDRPATDHCGSCTRCIDACPTDALDEPYRIDGSRCISYLTIELKSSIPDEFRESLGEWMFGCDICQDVCPWNRRATHRSIDDLAPREKMLIDDLEYWESLNEQEYEYLFNGTPVRRAKYPKFRENAQIVVSGLRKRKELRPS